MIFLVTNNPEFFRNEIYTTVSPKEAYTWLEKLTELCLDLETTGFDPHTERLLSLQLGNKERQYVIDCTSVDICLFKALLESRFIIGHYLKFDLKFLYKKGIYPRKIYDTLIVERILYCGFPSVRGGLEFVTERYLGYKLDKSVRTDIKKEGLSSRVIKYAADDILPLEDIKLKQIYDLGKKDMVLVANLENRFTPVLAYIEYCGFYLDPEKWRAKLERDRLEIVKAEDLLNHWVIKNGPSKFISKQQLDLFEPISCDINWTSQQQVIELFEELGINCSLEPNSKKKSLDAGILGKQSQEFEIIPLYFKYKKCHSVASIYGNSFIEHINPSTGRLHTNFTQITDTGRISSGGKNNVTGEDYINFQNIPGNFETRSCFCAERGNVLIISDYISQEPVVLCNKSLDRNLLKVFVDDHGDMHSFFASKLFPELNGISLEEIKKLHEDKRKIAKDGGLPINYGGVGSTIAKKLNISNDEGDKIYDEYFKAFPGIKNYFHRAKSQALNDGFILISDITRRKYYLPDFEKFKDLKKLLTPSFWEEYNAEKIKQTVRFAELKQIASAYYSTKGEIERKALNYPIQGSAAEIIKISCIYIFDWILKNELFGTVKFVNIIHDENVLECPENIKETVKQVVKDSMCKAGDIYCKTIPLKTELIDSNYWR